MIRIDYSSKSCRINVGEFFTEHSVKIVMEFMSNGSLDQYLVVSFLIGYSIPYEMCICDFRTAFIFW